MKRLLAFLAWMCLPAAAATAAQAPEVVLVPRQLSPHGWFFGGEARRARRGATESDRRAGAASCRLVQGGRK